ncbi:nicolin-1-like isoform X1 [Ischnura elegans]|uniref:nicolin-1-like isoform X1 n=1 Tax=Ischnura elegans TaxID=197161 RepID=UPI001ED8668F|nr:nicolin-1-like isoform X1 [Ischnura elegans]
MAAPHLRSRLPSHRDPVEFSIRGPVAVSLDEEQLTSPGCSVIDLLFPAATHVGELVFRNYYSGWISVLVRPGSSSSAEGLDESRPDRSKHPSSSWCMSVGRKTLMPLPHQEIGSHDLVSVVATESAAPWIGLTAMRLVLRQPSPSWRTFLVEEVAVYRDLPRRLPRPALPMHLTADGSLRCVDSASGPKEQAMPRKGSTDAGKGKRGETRPALLQRQQDGHLAVLHTRTALVWSPGNSSRGSLHSSRGGAHPKVVGTGGYEIVGLPQL